MELCKEVADGVFQIDGELTIHDIEDLNRFLDDHLGRSSKIMLNLSKVFYADMASLQLLIAFKKALKPEVEWKITELSQELEMILKVSGLRNVLVDLPGGNQNIGI